MNGISRRAFLRIAGLGALAGAFRPKFAFAINPSEFEIKGLINPHGLCAVDENSIAVAEAGSYSIKIFKIAPVELILSIGRAGSREGELNYPKGVSLDSNGNFVVCDTNNGRVCVFDRNGRFLKQFGSLGGAAGNLFSPHAARVYKNKLYVINTRGHWVTVFDYVTTEAVAVFGELGDDSDKPAQQGYKFRMPLDLWVDDEGIFVVDSKHSRIVILDHDGNLKKIVKLSASQPTNIVRTPELSAITDFSGKKIIFVDHAFSNFHEKELGFRPWGIAALKDNIWVSDLEGGRVIKID